VYRCPYHSAFVIAPEARARLKIRLLCKTFASRFCICTSTFREGDKVVLNLRAGIWDVTLHSSEAHDLRNATDWQCNHVATICGVHDFATLVIRTSTFLCLPKFLSSCCTTNISFKFIWCFLLYVTTLTFIYHGKLGFTCSQKAEQRNVTLVGCTKSRSG
jgi:hypothetical protein